MYTFDKSGNTCRERILLTVIVCITIKYFNSGCCSINKKNRNVSKYKMFIMSF